MSALFFSKHGYNGVLKKTNITKDNIDVNWEIGKIKHDKIAKKIFRLANCCNYLADKRPSNTTPKSQINKVSFAIWDKTSQDIVGESERKKRNVQIILSP